MKKIGIIGTRKRDSDEDLQAVRKVFDSIYEKEDWIVSGGCPKGGDRFAEIIAKDKGCPIIIFYPSWKELGRRAGFARNGHIALYSDVLIACVSEDRTGDTEDTIKKWRISSPNFGMVYIV